MRSQEHVWQMMMILSYIKMKIPPIGHTKYRVNKQVKASTKIENFLFD